MNAIRNPIIIVVYIFSLFVLIFITFIESLKNSYVFRCLDSSTDPFGFSVSADLALVIACDNRKKKKKWVVFLTIEKSIV